MFEVTLRTALAQGKDIHSPAQRAPTFEDFSHRWLEVHVRLNNKPSEQQTKIGTLKLHLLPYFGHLPLDQIRKMRIEEFKVAQLKKGLRPKTVNNQLAILSKCLRCAVEWEVIQNAPRVGMLRATAPPIQTLDTAQVNALLATTDGTRWAALIRVALRTGLRHGELIGLTWKNVDLDKRSITVSQSIVRGIVGTPKNHRARYIPLTIDAVAALRRLRETAPPHFEYVFSLDGTPLVPSQTHRILSCLAKKAFSRNIGWHLLRHTFATQLATRGAPLHLVKELLGHQTITMTMRYAHAAPEALHEAVALL